MEVRRKSQRKIIDDALKVAETKTGGFTRSERRVIKNKNELEKETRERRAELQRYEKRVLSKGRNRRQKSGCN